MRVIKNLLEVIKNLLAEKIMTLLSTPYKVIKNLYGFPLYRYIRYIAIKKKEERREKERSYILLNVLTGRTFYNMASAYQIMKHDFG